MKPTTSLDVLRLTEKEHAFQKLGGELKLYVLPRHAQGGMRLKAVHGPYRCLLYCRYTLLRECDMDRTLTELRLWCKAHCRTSLEIVADDNVADFKKYMEECRGQMSRV